MLVCVPKEADTMKALTLSTKRSFAGYTLLQMALAMLVLGLLVGGFLQIYSLYSQNQKILKTQQVVSDATSKIQAYRHVFGHYPCPASLNAARTAANYGTETNCSDVTTIAPGACAGGICIRSTTRLVDDDNDTTTPPVNMTLRVRIGAIPFRVLQMDEHDTFDSYGSRLTYAVTEAMGTLAGFQELRGGIDIVDEQAQSLIQPPGSAAFVILSHGPNRVGAYSSSSGTQIPCAGSGPDDLTNCIDPTVAGGAVNARFVNSFGQYGTAATTFDDVVSYFASAENPMWRRVAPGSEDIVDMSGNRVGVGTSTPQGTFSVSQSTVNPITGTMEVTNALTAGGVALESGALRASTDIRANTYCNPSGTKCFQTKDFKGDPDLSTGGMACPNGSYIAALTSNGTNTNAVPDCQPVRATCPAGQVFTGMSSSGVPQCAPLASGCSVNDSVTLCSTSISLAGFAPASTVAGIAPNQAWTSQVSAGACAHRRYECRNGSWDPVSSVQGSCTNTATTGVACGPGYTGTYTSYACGGGTFARTCTCQGRSYSETQSCASPFTGGSRSRTCTQDCANNVLQSAVCGDYTGSCQCDKPASKVTFSACSDERQRRSSPSPASFTFSDGSPSISWPADTTLGVYTRQTLNSATCEYTNATPNSSNCACAGPKYEERVDPPDHAPYNPPMSCWQALTSRDVYDNGVLALANVPHDKVVEKTPRDPDTCHLQPSQKTTLPDPALYTMKLYKWQKTSATPSATGQPAPGGEYPPIGHSCNCVTDGTGPARNCSEPSNGLYNIYPCECQSAQ